MAYRESIYSMPWLIQRAGKHEVVHYVAHQLCQWSSCHKAFVKNWELPVSGDESGDAAESWTPRNSMDWIHLWTSGIGQWKFEPQDILVWFCGHGKSNNPVRMRPSDFCCILLMWNLTALGASNTASHNAMTLIVTWVQCRSFQRHIPYCFARKRTGITKTFYNTHCCLLLCGWGPCT